MLKQEISLEAFSILSGAGCTLHLKCLEQGIAGREEARKQSQDSAMAPYVIVPLKYFLWSILKWCGARRWEKHSGGESRSPKAMDEAEPPQERRERADEAAGRMLVFLVNDRAAGLFSVLALVTA